jgi:excisionase family DNA binding protein
MQQNKTQMLLTVVEVAEQLGVKPGTIRAWIAQRRLPRVNCGRAVRIPSEAVKEFVERNTIPARQGRP